LQGEGSEAVKKKDEKRREDYMAGKGRTTKDSPVLRGRTSRKRGKPKRVNFERKLSPPGSGGKETALCYGEGWVGGVPISKKKKKLCKT